MPPSTLARARWRPPRRSASSILASTLLLRAPAPDAYTLVSQRRMSGVAGSEGVAVGASSATSSSSVPLSLFDPTNPLVTSTTTPSAGVDRMFGRGNGSSGNGNERTPAPGPDDDHPHPEAEVSDAEWEMRVARAMLHLRETLPRLFTDTTDDLFPRDVYSQQIVLKLPAPFPVRLSGLTGYRMAFSIGRSGLQGEYKGRGRARSGLSARMDIWLCAVALGPTHWDALMPALHADLGSTLERMTFSPPPPPGSVAEGFKRAPAHRYKQIRVMLSLGGSLRLPPHTRAEWHTSNLYTFNPYSGLIASHEVETIRPLPGEGVGEWAMQRLLGWHAKEPVRGPAGAGGAGAVRVGVPVSAHDGILRSRR